MRSVIYTGYVFVKLGVLIELCIVVSGENESNTLQDIGVNSVSGHTHRRTDEQDKNSIASAHLILGGGIKGQV